VYPGWYNGGAHTWIHIFSKKVSRQTRGLEDADPLVGPRGKAPVGDLGDNVPRSGSKCEIFVQFIMFSWRTCNI